MKTAFALLALVAAAQLASAATFVATNIVKDVKEDCPVANKPWDSDDFDIEQIGGMLAVLTPPAVTAECVSAAVANLATCATDHSLHYESGCCSKDCAAGLTKAVNSGCFEQYANVMCSNAEAKKFQKGLFNGAARCTGSTVSCSGTKATVTKAAAASKVANATSTAKTATTGALATAGAAVAGAGATAGAAVTGATDKVASALGMASPSPSPAATTSSAQGLAAGALVAAAAGATLLL